MSAPEPPATTPMLPEDDEPIPAGKAAVTVAGAILDLVTAVQRLEAVASAVARALDATGAP